MYKTHYRKSSIVAFHFSILFWQNRGLSGLRDRARLAQTLEGGQIFLISPSTIKLMEGLSSLFTLIYLERESDSYLDLFEANIFINRYNAFPLRAVKI